MEDLRKSTFASKNEENKRPNLFSIILGIFKYIRTKWKIILFWLVFIIIVNIIFNPTNTANFISNWYDNFIGTIIENSNE